MSASQEHIDLDTPMGTNLTANGATFRVWAPAAEAVYVCGDFNDWRRADTELLVRQAGTGYSPRKGRRAVQVLDKGKGKRGLQEGSLCPRAYVP
jgi:predicted carbohydrate-binding protein with CBM48